MNQLLAQAPRTAPDRGIEIQPAPNVTISRPLPAGFATWLPAIMVLVCTPLLALFVTKFALIPPMKRAAAQSVAWTAKATEPSCYVRIPLNAPGFRSLALVSSESALKGTIERNKAKLQALADGDFKDTSVSDLDKPGALDAKRAQLLADFNHELGDLMIQDVYIAVLPPKKS
jgi:hypothetical protein